MLHHRSGLPLFCAAVFAALALSATGCIFSPEDDDDDPDPTPPITISRSRPDSLLIGLQRIYNDKEHSAIERVNAYDSLFLKPDPNADPPRTGFLFNFQPADQQQGLPANWGLDAELEAHRGLFTAQENGEIYLLELRITYGATEPIDNDPEKVDWQQIFASNVYLRLMFNPNDGLEVNGGQADFEFAPELSKPPAQPGGLYGGYWIGEWTDLPRP